MPSKNTIRQYIENGYYHIYNRGVEKRRIFEESADYKNFLYYLKVYLNPVDILRQENPLLRFNLIKANLSEQLDLIAYCLMPNHFHLLVRQKTIDAITKLMHQITTAHTMYFNKKYERVGSLFQGRFKAVIVENDEYLLHLSRYIHQNPKERGVSLADFPWSSYSSYVSENKNTWLKSDLVLDYFSKNKENSYKNFVEENFDPNQEIEKLTLD